MGKRYFPMFVDISEEKVVVIGGGRIGKRRLKTLMEFVNQVILIEPNPDEEIQELEQDKKIMLIQDLYHIKYIQDAYMVVAATDVREVNQQVKDDCCQIEKDTGRKIYVNISDKRELNDFYFPGVVIAQDLVVGINSGGASPALVKETRRKLESTLTENGK